METIKGKLQNIITSVIGSDYQQNVVTEASDTDKQLIIDSLLALQIIVLIEQEFNIMIDDDAVAIDMLGSLEKATSYVEASLQENGIFLTQ